MHALGLEFGSAAQLSKRPGSVWNCLWGNALKRSPGIIRKSRVSYPVPGFLSSATWPSLPKKHYNGLNQTKHHDFRLSSMKGVTDRVNRQLANAISTGSVHKPLHRFANCFTMSFNKSGRERKVRNRVHLDWTRLRQFDSVEMKSWFWNTCNQSEHSNLTHCILIFIQ